MVDAIRRPTRVIRLDRSRELRIGLDVWNIIWSGVSSLVIPGAALLCLGLLVFSALLGFEAAVGRHIVTDPRDPSLLMASFFFGFALVVAAVGWLLVHATTLPKYLSGAGLLLALLYVDLTLFLPDFLRWLVALPAWFGDVAAFLAVAWADFPRWLDPREAMSPPGLLLFAGSLFVAVGLIADEPRRRWEWVLVVLAGGWATIAAIVILAPIFLSAQGWLALLAVLFVVLLLWATSDSWYGRNQPIYLAMVVLLVAAVILLVPPTRAQLAAFDLSMAPLFMPGQPMASPFSAWLFAIPAIALVLWGWPLAIDRATYPRWRIAFAVASGLASLWLAFAIYGGGLASWRLAGGEVLRALATLGWAALDQFRLGFVLIWATLSDLLYRLLIQFLTALPQAWAVLWPAFLVFSTVFWGYLTYRLGRIGFLLAHERFALAVAQYPIPRGFWRRLKYAAGIAPIGYMGRVASASSTATILISRFLHSGSLGLLLVLYLSLNASGMQFGEALVHGRSGEGAFANVPGLVVPALAGVGLLLASYGLRLLGYRFRPRQYDKIRLRDSRRPLLFLRSFRDDHVKLDMSPLRPVDAPTNLDQLLVHLGGAYGPVIALGRPDQKLPPFGAARLYVRDGSWQDVVASLAMESTAILFCVDDTEGVHWEINHIIETGQVAKTLFFFHPRAPDAVRKNLIERLGYELPDLPEPPRHWRDMRLRSLLGFIAGPGEGTVLVHAPGTVAYHCAITAGLLLLLGYAERSVAWPKLPQAPLISLAARRR